MAECSESAGVMAVPCLARSGRIAGPPAISVSLFANAISLPASIAATVGARPAVPTTPVTTTSAPCAVAHALPASAPATISRPAGSTPGEPSDLAEKLSTGSSRPLHAENFDSMFRNTPAPRCHKCISKALGFRAGRRPRPRARRAAARVSTRRRCPRPSPSAGTRRPGQASRSSRLYSSPRNIHVASPRRASATRHPRRRRDSSPRNLHVAPLVSAEYPRGTRGVAAIHRPRGARACAAKSS